MVMRYKALKRVTKGYDEIFTKNKETDEIHVVIGGSSAEIDIYIINQQCGRQLDTPQIILSNKNGSYEIKLEELINKLIK